MGGGMSWMRVGLSCRVGKGNNRVDLYCRGIYYGFVNFQVSGEVGEVRMRIELLG